MTHSSIISLILAGLVGQGVYRLAKHIYEKERLGLIRFIVYRWVCRLFGFRSFVKKDPLWGEGWCLISNDKDEVIIQDLILKGFHEEWARSVWVYGVRW